MPSPPSGKTGWPWTAESPQLPGKMPDGKPWSKVSIVTPSYNQGQFIEETIRSVLFQGYPNLEYIIIDGGSTDGSVDIIRKYEPWLAYWVSEPDQGQANAINKGWRRSSGEVMAWLNSDDVYLPKAVGDVTEFLCSNGSVDVAYGDAFYIDERSQTIERFIAHHFDLLKLLHYNILPQPAAFIRRNAIVKVGGLDESFHLCLDHDLWLRMSGKCRFQYIQKPWAQYRLHPSSKGSTQHRIRWEETIRMLERFLANQDVQEDVKGQQDKILGRAHWYASVACWSAGDRIKAQEHAIESMRLYPDYLCDWHFAEEIVNSLRGDSRNLMRALDEFYLGVTPQAKNRIIDQGLASANAVVALDEAMPENHAARHAWQAIRRDPRWLTNHHIVSRALVPILGSRGVSVLRHTYRIISHRS